MGLVLQPALTDDDRKALEEWRSVVQTKRLTAVIVYQQGISAKLGKVSETVKRKIAAKSRQLQNAVNALDKADARLAKLLADLTMLLTEQGQLQDLISVQPQYDTVDEDEDEAE